MKTIIYFFILCILGLNFTACKNQKTGVTDQEYSYIQAQQDSINKINEMMDTSNCVQYSLEYSNPKSDRYFATMFCDKDGNVHKMKEQISSSSLLSENTIYYNSKGKLYATTSEYQQKQDTATVFVEELTIYNAKGKIDKQFKRITTAKEQGEYLPSTDNKVITKDKIIRAMNNEGEFTLTFQGIIKTDNLDFILVGGPGKDDYNSALQIEGNYPFMNQIYANEREFVGRKIAVNFERKQMGNFAYQAYVAAKWVD